VAGVLINGLDYHVGVRGAGERALLLLHGFTGSSSSWQPLVEAWQGSFRLILVDLPGHGRTVAPADPERYSIEATAADLEEVLQQVAAVPVDVLGYSMGGRLALYLALTRPHLVRTLILESASPGLKTEAERAQRRRQDDELADFIEREGIAAFVERWEQLPLWDSQAQCVPAVRARLRRQRLQNRPLGLANSLRGMGSGAQPSLWPHLAHLNAPVLLLAGELDGKFVAVNREMAAAMPQASLLIVPGAGHTIHLEQPQLFRDAVERFLL
jgi:2-succinyl-6-hydroxy-2,4-cyclohexadiene-1-carboxylate synthase